MAAGRFVTLDVPGVADTTPQSINDWGQIVGYASDTAGSSVRGFLPSRGRHRTFVAPGVPITLPTGINNRGQITGSTLTPSAADPLAEARGFLLARGVKGGFTPVDVPGAPRTLVTGLNDRGQLVGAYENTNATPNRQGTGAQPPAAGDARALAARMGSAGLRTDPWPPPVANTSNQTDAHSSEETTS